MVRPSRSVLFRDAAIFLLKLWIDGLKDIALTALAVGALLIDVVFRRSSERFLFYRVVRAGERFDMWLNLYSASKTGGESEEGFFASSRAGEDTFLGRLEELTGGERSGRKRPGSK
jgi:hypothetical protein